MFVIDDACAVIEIAARMLDSIDQTVDPCDDFFEYACGTWNRLHPIPEDRPNYSTFRKLDDQLQSTLRGSPLFI